MKKSIGRKIRRKAENDRRRMWSNSRQKLNERVMKAEARLLKKKKKKEESEEIEGGKVNGETDNN